MTFTGLATNLLLAVGGVAMAATVLLYILKLRRRPVSVPFSPIWKRVLRDQESTQWFSKLKRLLSLLVQLAVVALLVLALGNPRLSKRWLEGRNIVVLVDTSASMKATDVKPTRLEEAKHQIAELLGSLGAADRALIAEMGATPQPLTTMTDDPAALNAALKQIRARDTHAALHAALRFAIDSLNGLEHPEIVIFSDGALDGSGSPSLAGDPKKRSSAEPASQFKVTTIPEAIKFRHVPIGTGGSNVAITQFAVRRYPLDKSRYEVLLEVANTHNEPAQVELTLLGDGEVVDVSTLILQPNERLPRFYQNLAGAQRRLEARLRLLDGEDKLPADNKAFALMPERRPLRILLVSAGNTYAQAALLLEEYLDVTQVEPGQPLPDQDFDVTILDSVAPALYRRHGARLYLNPPETGSPVPFKGDITNFGFDIWDRKSPYLRWMAMENIQVTQGHALAPRQDDDVIGASELGPILVAGEREGTPFLVLGFDPRHSDFVLRVGWPLFLLNVINHFAAEDGDYLSAYRTGAVWHIPVPDQLDSVRVTTPDGETISLPVKDGRAVHFGEAAGFYSVSNAAGEVVGGFAANLSDIAESTLAEAKPLEFGTRKAEGLPAPTQTPKWPLWTIFLFAALLLSVTEWFTYHRRVTV